MRTFSCLSLYLLKRINDIDKTGNKFRTQTALSPYEVLDNLRYVL
jgi:hypothetical protein